MTNVQKIEMWSEKPTAFDSFAQNAGTFLQSYMAGQEVKKKREAEAADRMMKLLPTLAAMRMLKPASASDKDAIKVDQGNGQASYFKVSSAPPDTTDAYKQADEIEDEVRREFNDGNGDRVMQQIYNKAQSTIRNEIVKSEFNRRAVGVGLPPKTLSPTYIVAGKKGLKYNTVDEMINGDPERGLPPLTKFPDFKVASPSQQRQMEQMESTQPAAPTPQQSGKQGTAGKSISFSKLGQAAAVTAGVAKAAKPFLTSLVKGGTPLAKQGLSESAKFFMKTGASAATRSAASQMAAGIATRGAIGAAAGLIGGAAAPAALGWGAGGLAGDTAYNMNPNLLNSVPNQALGFMAHPLGYMFNQQYNQNPMGYLQQQQ